MATPRIIILYATSGCPRCAAAREAIRATGEAWEERDPTADGSILQELLSFTASATVPTIVTGNRALVGFDRDRFDLMMSTPPYEPPYREPETPEEQPEADPVLRPGDPSGRIPGAD